MENSKLYQLLDEAIGLFIEYEQIHGHDRQRARGAAVLEVLEGYDMEQSLAEVRAAMENRLAGYSLDHETVTHLYHCALVNHLRDGLAPKRAVKLAWHKNILGD